MNRTLCAPATALLLAAMRISAHHAFAAEYDENDRVSNVANARTVTLPDGRKLFGGFQTTPGAPVK